jgi:diadenosine tetraphosphate (Ap4A) HIT family hydrolase
MPTSTIPPAAPATQRLAGCPLCDEPGGLCVWRDGHWRVVRVEDVDFPAFYRVVSEDHVVEFSDLPPARRERCLALVCAVERTLLARLRPAKVNLAALGNVVPHLHWHVVARFGWDSHFPQPIWGTRQREVSAPAHERLPLALPELDAAVAYALDAAGVSP